MASTMKLYARLGPLDLHLHREGACILARAQTFRGVMGRFAEKSRQAIALRRRDLFLQERLRQVLAKFGENILADTERVVLRDGDSFSTTFQAPKLYRIVNRGAFRGPPCVR